MNEDAIIALHAEWEVVSQDGRALRTVADWLGAAGVMVPSGASLAGLLEALEEEDHRNGREHTDRWMGALLQRATATGPEAQLAARVMVQAMLPYAARTTRLLLRGQPWGDDASVVVACLYETVRQYPLGRRPRRITTNIAMDTRKRAVRELRRESSGEEEEWLGAPGDEELWEQAVGRRGVYGDGDEAASRVVLARSAQRAGLHPQGRADDELEGSRGEVVELLLWALERRVLSGGERGWWMSTTG